MSSNGPGSTQAAELAELIEMNVSAFLLQMGRTGGGHERSVPAATWTVGGSPIGYHNAIVRFDASPAQAEALVGEFHDELRARRLPGSCHLSPTMRPTNLAELLIDRGFEDGGDEPAMAADLTTITDVSPADLTVTRVTTSDELDAYRDVLALGFGEGPKEADWVRSVFAAIGYDAAWNHFIGGIDGTAVAAASTLLTPPVAGIYFVCTTPGHRRKGYGAAITRAAMLDAARRGATHAVLGSSPMGQRIYEALGFQTVFTYQLLEWEP